MDKIKIDKLREINKRILNCKECIFHEELKNRGLCYKPDAPWYDPDRLARLDFKVISIGLNPGWDDNDIINNKDKYEPLYKLNIQTNEDHDHYFKNIYDIYQATPRRKPYQDSLTKTFNLINQSIKLYDNVGEISSENIYDYLFWGNLSWCNSQTTYQRTMWGNKDIICNVLTEEIPNCLDKGYMKDIITCVEPEMLLFFGSSFPFHPKVITKKVLDTQYDNISYTKKSFVAHTRKQKNKVINVSVDISICLIKEKNMRVVFMPHPNYRWEDHYREEAIKWICDQIKIL